MITHRIFAFATTVAVAAFAATAQASDHFDGPGVLADPSIDITDMYVFPSPEHRDRLVLVMDIHPAAGADTWFSDALEYRFRLRPVTIAGTGAKAGFTVGQDEVVFSCTFSDLDGTGDGTVQNGRCETPDGALDISVNEVGPDEDFGSNGLKAFAGLRLDPFFMDVPGIIQSMQQGRLNFTRQNTAQDKNVLGIVLEIDTARFLPDPGGMYGVVSEIRTRGGKQVVMDTFGRPELTNVILSDPSFDAVNRSADLRDLFNRFDPFGEAGPYGDTYRARLNANLHRLDTLDGQTDWPMLEGVHPLTELQLADFTVIDLSKPVGNGSWFEIERAIVEGREHTTGGGRWLDDDICDIQYGFLVARDRMPISDGVDAPTKLAAERFPYLNDPIR